MRQRIIRSSKSRFRFEQPTDRVLITLSGVVQQDLGFVLVGPHNDRLPQEMRGDGSMEGCQIRHHEIGI
jgi:hypothetical protein